jgi:hypothetical protein
LPIATLVVSVRSCVCSEDDWDVSCMVLWDPVVGWSVDLLCSLGVDPVCSHADSANTSAKTKAIINERRLAGLRLLMWLRVTGGRDQIISTVRTRTDDWLITSDNSGVAEVCTGLQIPHI